ncbi:MAG: hypothetical protein WDN27_05015 [Candidatus Saccharibacteria bacterium]
MLPALYLEPRILYLRFSQDFLQRGVGTGLQLARKLGSQEGSPGRQGLFGNALDIDALEQLVGRVLRQGALDLGILNERSRRYSYIDRC